MKYVELIALLRTLGDASRDPLDFAGSPEVLEVTRLYLSLSVAERREVIDEIGTEGCRLLGRYVSRFCGDAIDQSSTSFVFAAIMMLELSSVGADWRIQLVRLLVIDHTLARLKSSGVNFEMKEWEKVSPGTFKSFQQLDNRKPSLRNLSSVELREVSRIGHTFFEHIAA